MHELSVAQSVVDFALSEADRNGSKRVLEVQVEVGDFTMIDVSVLSRALRMLMSGPRLEGCKVRVRKKAVKFVCRKCGETWSMAEAMKQLEKVPDGLRVREPDSKEVPTHFLPSLYPAFVSCPRCGSADAEAEGGEGTTVRRLVLE